jgi:SAM-dependent methyltransferase
MPVPFPWRGDQFETLLASCLTDEATPYMLRHLPRNGRVLEAGCGLGRFVRYLKSHGFLNIVGVEISEDAVRTLKDVAPDLNVQCGDILDLPFGDCSIEGVISLGVVEHFPEGPQKALREMFRVMSPTSRAIITVPYLNWIRRIKYATRAYEIGAFVRRLTDGQSDERRCGADGHNVVRATISRLEESRHVEDVRVNSSFVRWPVSGPFFEYRFSVKQIQRELTDAGFWILERSHTNGIGGLFYEFGKVLVRTSDEGVMLLNPLGRFINKMLSAAPSVHSHMVLFVVEKPERAAHDPRV